MPVMIAHPKSLRTRVGHAPARGLSIVELMIGITISLFILAGATLVLTSQLGDNRRLLLEAQMQQDLRTAADMISRDIRRAGYWGHAYRSICPPPPEACVTAVNPYEVMVPLTAPAGTTEVRYIRSTDEEGARPIGFDDDRLDLEDGRPREQVGFKWNAEKLTIDYLVGANNNWQALTDSTVMQVTQFDMVINASDLPVRCDAGACPVLGPVPGPGPGVCQLVLRSRDVTVIIVAQAVHDATVRRSVRDNVRLRNHVPTVVCAAPPAVP